MYKMQLAIIRTNIANHESHGEVKLNVLKMKNLI